MSDIQALFLREFVCEYNIYSDLNLKVPYKDNIEVANRKKFNPVEPRDKNLFSNN